MERYTTAAGKGVRARGSRRRADRAVADVTRDRARNIATIGAERSKAKAAVLRTLRGHDFSAAAARAAGLIANPDETVASIRLERFLSSVSGLGAYRIDRLMSRAKLRPARLTRKIGELTDRERRVIAAALAAALADAFPSAA